MKNKALIVVDYQYDFADPKGSLYVPFGETIKSGIENKIKEYKKNNQIVIFSQDYHPENHDSFKQWPVHCVANTKGCEFYIDHSNADLIVKKGTKIDGDSYSAFYIVPEEKSQLDDYLKKHNIKELEICGLALDVCVIATYNDALKLDYKATINEELSKAIDENFKLVK